MDGVAANAGCTREDGLYGMVRCSVRMRRGSTTPKPLKAPTQVPEDTESRNGSALRVRPRSMVSQSTPLSGLAIPRPLQPLELDTDTETEVGTETSTGTETTVDDAGPYIATSPSIHQTCTDFSNYLGISLRDEGNTASVTAVDSDSFARVDSVDDAYGWEAELDKKLQYDVASVQPLCPYQYTRRAMAAKHSLLHRVFSMQSNRRANFRR